MITVINLFCLYALGAVVTLIWEMQDPDFMAALKDMQRNDGGWVWLQLALMMLMFWIPMALRKIIGILRGQS